MDVNPVEHLTLIKVFGYGLVLLGIALVALFITLMVRARDDSHS